VSRLQRVGKSDCKSLGRKLPAIATQPHSYLIYPLFLSLSFMPISLPRLQPSPIQMSTRLCTKKGGATYTIGRSKDVSRSTIDAKLPRMVISYVVPTSMDKTFKKNPPTYIHIKQATCVLYGLISLCSLLGQYIPEVKRNHQHPYYVLIPRMKMTSVSHTCLDLTCLGTIRECGYVGNTLKLVGSGSVPMQ